MWLRQDHLPVSHARQRGQPCSADCSAVLQQHTRVFPERCLALDKVITPATLIGFQPDRGQDLGAAAFAAVSPKHANQAMDAKDLAKFDHFPNRQLMHIEDSLVLVSKDCFVASL